MADQITIPLSLAGVEKVQRRMQKLFQNTVTSASDLQDAMRRMERIQTRHLKAEGMTSGLAITPVTMKDVRIGERQVQKLNEKTGELETVTEAITEDVYFQVRSQIEENVSQRLKKDRRAIRRRARKAPTSKLEKALVAQEKLQDRVKEAFGRGEVSQEFLDTVLDDTKQLQLQLDASREKDQKKKDKRTSDRLKARTARMDRKVKETLLQINEYSLNTVDSVNQAQREAEELLLKMQGDVGKPGGVSQASFDQLRRKEQGLRKQQETVTKNTAKDEETDLMNKVKTHYDDRRRVLKEQFKSAGGDINKLQSVFDEQRNMLNELETVGRAGVLNTNQRTQQTREELRKTGEKLRTATMDQMTRSDRFAVMTPDERREEMNRRKEVRERARSKKRQERKDKDKGISEATLGAASIGIGLFGQAGFPLLNVGFAAMSSPAIGAMAAVSTAAGETARALSRFRESVLQIADSTGFLTKEFKLMRGELEGTKAVFGGLAAVGEALAMQQEMQALRNRSGGIVAGMAGEQQFMDTLLHPLRDMMAGNMPFNFAEAGRRAVQQELMFMNSMDEMIERARRRAFQFNARFEGGEGMFRRIQEAAGSGRETEQEVLRSMLKAMEETRDAIRAAETEEQRRFEEERETNDRMRELFGGDLPPWWPGFAPP